MRRFLAYVVMMVTMLFAIIFNIQTVLQNKNDAMEYGTGTQLVYSLTDRVLTDYDAEKYPAYKNSLKTLSEIDIEAAIMARLDLAGVRNADVSIVKGERDTDVSNAETGYQLRVNLSPLSEGELNNVKEILAITGSLSIGTEGDSNVLYAANDEFFDTDGDVATLIYHGTSPVPSIKVKDVETFEALKKSAEEAVNNRTSEAGRIYRADGEEEKEQEVAKLFLWSNKKLADTYDKAYGTHETVIMEDTKAKVLAEIPVTNWNQENLLLSIASDINGETFTISSARAFVNMLNAKDYGFDIQFLYQNSLHATFGNQAMTLTYVIFGVVLLVICALMIAFYGLAGVTASLTMLGSVVTSFFLFSVLGFEFSIAALSGLAIIVGLSIMISVNYFERVKTELRRGRDIVKANQEGYHKSFLTSLDVSAVALFSSIFCFLIGTGALKTFFGVIMVGSIFTFLITNFLNKWMLYWLVKDNSENKLPFFSFRKNDGETLEDKANKTNKKFLPKSLLAIIPGVAALVFAIALPVKYFTSGSNRSFFNNFSDFASTYTLNISFVDRQQAYEKLSSSAIYTQYLVDLGKNNDTGSYTAISSKENKNSDTKDSFIYYPDTATVNVVKSNDEENNTYYTIYYSIQVNKDLDTVVDENDTKAIDVIENSMLYEDIESSAMIISPFAGDSHGDKDSLKVGSYEVKATNVAHTSFYMILVSFLVSAFAFIYLLIRFGLVISLTSLISGSVANLFFIGLLSLFSIPFSSYTVFAVMISIMALNMFFVPVLGRNKELLKESGLKKTATAEQREEFARVASNKALPMIVPVFAVLLVYSLAMAFLNVSLLGLSIAAILFIIIDFALLYFFAVPLYAFLANKISFAKFEKWNEERRAKRQAKRKDKQDEIKKVAGPDGVIYVDDGPHETIIPGLNDFPKND